MKENELFKRLNEVNGNALVIGFSNDSDVNVAIESAEKLENEGRIELVDITKYDDNSLSIKAYVK
ncbi:hypothetical protein [Viridibacillus arvi]|uniref:hypothetical protein n=1 Tax=Viridibacillus arvi TaxID=263475 RepID=UPI003D29CBB0